MAGRRRLDAELVRRGLASSRGEARELVAAGRVLAGGSLALKPARMVDPADPLEVTGDPPRFVGRGGEKLAAALERFGIDVGGLRVLDAGASTGGFTDCLLKAGAAEVVALDVGHGQLHESLRADERVEVIERTNLRTVEPGQLGTLDAAVADLSFISLTVVMETLVSLVDPSGWMVLLAKPQFEAGRREVSRGGGVVRDPEVWRGAVMAVVSSAEALGAAIMGVMVSPIRGAQGNVEFLLHVACPGDAAAQQPCDSQAADLVRSAVRDAETEGGDGR